MPDHMRIFDYAIATVVILLLIIVVFQSFEINGLNSKLSADYFSANSARSAVTSTISNTTSTSLNSFGSRLTNIDKPFNSSDLAVINDAPDSYFEAAAQKLIQGNLTDEVLAEPYNQSIHAGPYILGGKPTVIYLGAISCVFCGENRWAMALALSRFGNFSSLYEGYSSFGDHNLPTIYWSADNYTTPEGVGFGNSYSSKYINFLSADYLSPIVQGFEVQPLSYFVSESPNSTYKSAISFMNSTNQFQGTPFTLWGNTLVTGADAVVFGNSTPTSTTLPLTYETHSQVLNQLKNFNDQFSWGDYAAADVYIAYTCPSINDTAPICNLPAIKQLISNIGA